MAKPVLAINARTLANSGCNVAVIPSQLILGPASHLRHRNAKASKWQRMLQWFFGTHLRPLVRHKGPQKIWRAQFTCTPAVHSVSADTRPETDLLKLIQCPWMPVGRWMPSEFRAAGGTSRLNSSVSTDILGFSNRKSARRATALALGLPSWLRFADDR